MMIWLNHILSRRIQDASIIIQNLKISSYLKSEEFFDSQILCMKRPIFGLKGQLI